MQSTFRTPFPLETARSPGKPGGPIPGALQHPHGPESPPSTLTPPRGHPHPPRGHPGGADTPAQTPPPPVLVPRPGTQPIPREGGQAPTAQGGVTLVSRPVPPPRCHRALSRGRSPRPGGAPRRSLEGIPAVLICKAASQLIAANRLFP